MQVNSLGRRIMATVLGGAAALMIGSATARAADQGPDQAKVTHVTIRFSWKLKGEYAPLYVALDKGYFSAEGLDVQLGEGAGSQAALASLIRGDDQAVWLPGIFALQATSKGMPVKLVALYNPSAPILIISWPDKPVRAPKDLEGKSIATAVGETGTTFLPVLCAKNHVDCGKIKLVHMEIESRVPAFVAHKVDAVSVYRTNDMPILQAKFGDNAFVQLDEAKWGAGVPGSSLVASNTYIDSHPQVLAKLVHAINRGMEYSAKNPTDAAEIMLKHWSSSLSKEVVAHQIEGLIEAMPKDNKPSGYISRPVLVDALAALKAAHQVESTKPVDDYYTNSIVQMAKQGS